MRDDQAAGQRADRRAERDAHGDRRIGNPAPFGGNVPGDDLGASREGEALADAEHDAEHEERHEPADEPHQERARGPHQDAAGEQFVDGEAVAQPAGEQLHRRIDPEESGDGETVGFVRKAELALHQRRGDRHRAAVDIIEENRDAEQEDRARSTTLRSRCGMPPSPCRPPPTRQN